LWNEASKCLVSARRWKNPPPVESNSDQVHSFVASARSCHTPPPPRRANSNPNATQASDGMPFFATQPPRVLS